MAVTVAVAAIVIGLLVGNFWGRWRLREASLRSARAQAAGAGVNVWKARKALIFGGIALIAFIEYWLHGR